MAPESQLLSKIHSSVVSFPSTKYLLLLIYVSFISRKKYSNRISRELVWRRTHEYQTGGDAQIEENNLPRQWLEMHGYGKFSWQFPGILWHCAKYECLVVDAATSKWKSAQLRRSIDFKLKLSHLFYDGEATLMYFGSFGALAAVYLILLSLYLD